MENYKEKMRSLAECILDECRKIDGLYCVGLTNEKKEIETIKCASIFDGGDLEIIFGRNEFFLTKHGVDVLGVYYGPHYEELSKIGAGFPTKYV